jgi:hypothetical protein
VKSVDDHLKSQRDTFAGGSDAFVMNRAALRLDMPEDMNKRQRGLLQPRGAPLG